MVGRAHLQPHLVQGSVGIPGSGFEGTLSGQRVKCSGLQVRGSKCEKGFSNRRRIPVLAFGCSVTNFPVPPLGQQQPARNVMRPRASPPLNR